MSRAVQVRYTCGEEIANGITHGIGAFLAIAGLAVMTAFATLHGDVWHIVSCAVFGATLILLYTASTLYHSIPHERAKGVLRALDHSAIFLLIAGTYTPFTLVSLRGPWGWGLFATIWTLALAGILLRLVLRGRLHGLIVGLYVAMGWVIVVAIVPLAENLATDGLLLLAGGGLAYMVGVFFYKWRSLRYHHAVWHGFVLLGSALHFFSVLFYVIPWPAGALA
ncbi:MAG: hemolysin III family protein [Rhodocyclaceae bacterium]|nr:hemolysin III family protein [Rhodocyclaceae bacterium]